MDVKFHTRGFNFMLKYCKYCFYTLTLPCKVKVLPGGDLHVRSPRWKQLFCFLLHCICMGGYVYSVQSRLQYKFNEKLNPRFDPKIMYNRVGFAAKILGNAAWLWVFFGRPELLKQLVSALHEYSWDKATRADRLNIRVLSWMVPLSSSLFVVRYVVDVFMCAGFSSDEYCLKYATNTTEYFGGVLLPSINHLLEGLLRLYSSSTMTLFFMLAALTFQISGDFTEYINTLGLEEPSSVRLVCQAYQDVKNLVEQINALGSSSNLSVIVFGICIYSSIQTTFLSSPQENVERNEPKVILLLSFGFFFLSLILAAEASSQFQKARQFVSSALNAQRDMSTDEVTRAFGMLVEVSTNPIGLKVLSFTITYSFVVTVFSTVLTYTFILLQF